MKKGQSCNIFSSNGLKIMACICMLLDHIGYGMNNFLPFRYVGRLAFPVFAFLVAVGAEKTRHEMQYLIRIIVFAVISEPIYDLYFNNGKIDFSYDLNILFTLFAGILIIFAFKEYNLIFGELALICSIPIAIFMDFSYGVPGVLLIVGYYFANKIHKNVIKNVALSAVTILFAMLSVLNGSKPYQLLCIASIIPILLFNGQKGKIYKKQWKNSLVKYSFYAFYPMHIAILLLLNFLKKLF